MQYKARFFNGESLEPKHILLGFDAGRLMIKDENGHTLSAHPKPEIILLFADQLGNRVDLGVNGLKDYRLMVEAPGIKQDIVQYLPQVGRPILDHGWAAGLKISAFLVGFIVFVGLLAWQIERILPNFVPTSYAESFGRTIADEYIDEYGGVCSASDGMQSLNKMVMRLQPNAEANRLTVRVADSDMVNAFAVPGKQIVIFRGLLDEAASADEVAGVLAHEMGHVQHKHALRGLTRAIGIGVIASIFSGGDVSQIVQQLVALGFSRSMEEEADKEALETLSRAGVDHNALAMFFDRIAAENESAKPAFMSFLSTHPSASERAVIIRSVRPTAETWPVISETQWLDLKNICGERE